MQLLAENAPAAGPLREVVQNILDEPVPQRVKERLSKPLLPGKNKPITTPRKKKEIKRRAILKEFDPIQPIKNQEKSYEGMFANLFKRGEEEEGEEKEGRLYIFWRKRQGLENDLTGQFMGKIREKVRTAAYLRHNYSYWLENIEDGTILLFYKNSGGSPWINRYDEAENWLREKEEARLNIDNFGRPNTKWVFRGYSDVDVKVVLDRQPLLGTGPLPDRLRNFARGRAGPMVALDTYQDNLCLWRCIAVHRGARPDRSTTAARELAKGFFKLRAAPNDSPKTSLDELDRVERRLNQGAAFSDWLGIRVYEPVRVEGEVVWHLRRNPPAKLTNTLTIGNYEGHAFFIKNISKLARTYACVHCRARFTQTCNLQRHTKRCAQGKTVNDCPAERVEAPQTAFEKAFYPKHTASPESLRWLEQEAARRKIHIHHAACGHGGERWVERAPVDRYNHETRTVFQYHGCHWHGCRKCYPNDCDKIIANNGQTRGDRFKATVKRTNALRAAGYHVIEVWACEVGEIDAELPQPQTQSFAHEILYDFEAYGDKNQRKEPTDMLTIENAHVPISVSVGDTFDRKPTHICEKDLVELVRKFMEELKRRGENIRTKVRAAFMPDDLRMLPKVQRIKIEEWCDQVPVLGFNSRRYDLSLIREHFAERLSDRTNKVKVAKNGNKIMFLLTQGFRFLDIINYLGPGTSYEKWTKAYECTAEKSWFPYKWFDTPEKLDHPGLPDYPAWHSRVKGCYVLKLSEWRACKRVFKERNMQMFADWLHYYNNLDVAPGLEALERMRAFYTEKGIDILKDAVSIPEASLHYLLRGAVERGAEFYSPGKEAYEMLKGAAVGGPSLVFTRYHEVGVTKIRSHQTAEPRLCQRILGCDANALYLSTMLEEMPCGKEKVVHYTGRWTVGAAPQLTQRLKNGTWFGFPEVDIEIPEPLRPKFEEMCPFFYNRKGACRSRAAANA